MKDIGSALSPSQNETHMKTLPLNENKLHSCIPINFFYHCNHKLQFVEQQDRHRPAGQSMTGCNENSLRHETGRTNAKCLKETDL